jgi:hypothetical protein
MVEDEACAKEGTAAHQASARLNIPRQCGVARRAPVWTLITPPGTRLDTHHPAELAAAEHFPSTVGGTMISCMEVQT